MTRPLHVLSVIGHLGFGGAENRLLALAHHIDRNRFAHWTVTPGEMDLAREEAARMLRQYKEAEIRMIHLPTAGKAKVPRLAQRVWALCKTIEQLDIDIVDAHCESAALWCTLAGLITGRHRIATIYHPHPLFAPKFWSVAGQFMFANLDLVITDSAPRAREIQNASRFKSLDVAVVPNGISPPEPARDRRMVRRDLGLPDDPNTRVIAQVSALREFKGHLILLEAAKAVLAADKSAFFLFVGYEKDEPGFKERVERRVAELEISDRVRVVGYPGPIGDVWSVVDIHVHASTFDSLPNAIIEGMSLAKPCVVTSVGGIPDAVAHGKTGIVVPPGDSAAVAEALIHLLRNPSLAAALGQAALSRYRRSYRPDVMARKLESCFVGVVRGSSPPSLLCKNSASTGSW
jgi:glycosyltransferase involved in cell wall biosynthesis